MRSAGREKDDRKMAVQLGTFNWIKILSDGWFFVNKAIDFLFP